MNRKKETQLIQLTLSFSCNAFVYIVGSLEESIDETGQLVSIWRSICRPTRRARECAFLAVNLTFLPSLGFPHRCPQNLPNHKHLSVKRVSCWNGLFILESGTHWLQGNLRLVSELHFNTHQCEKSKALLKLIATEGCKQGSQIWKSVQYLFMHVLDTVFSQANFSSIFKKCVKIN